MHGLRAHVANLKFEKSFNTMARQEGLINYNKEDKYCDEHGDALEKITIMLYVLIILVIILVSMKLHTLYKHKNQKREAKLLSTMKSMIDLNSK